MQQASMGFFQYSTQNRQFKVLAIAFLRISPNIWLPNNFMYTILKVNLEFMTMFGAQTALTVFSSKTKTKPKHLKCLVQEMEVN